MTTATTTADPRLVEAECYVRVRFYPPLPFEYGAYAVQAIDACAEGEPERQIMLDPTLSIHPARASHDESGSVSVKAEDLVDALHLWHMVEEAHDCADHLVEQAGPLYHSGAFRVWDECEICGATSAHRVDTVL